VPVAATLKSRIPQIIALLPEAAEAEALALAEDIAVRAKENAPDAPPIGEGLVDAIHVEPDEEGFRVVAGDEDVFYGHFVEFGTAQGATAKPFLIPAFEEAAQSAGNISFNL
jgi:HK97 gp10 family phage protein